eukprot:4268119-Pleurochrysis_carterae.AAC.1
MHSCEHMRSKARGLTPAWARFLNSSSRPLLTQRLSQHPCVPVVRNSPHSDIAPLLINLACLPIPRRAEVKLRRVQTRQIPALQNQQYCAARLQGLNLSPWATNSSFTVFIVDKRQLLCVTCRLLDDLLSKQLHYDWGCALSRRWCMSLLTEKQDIAPFRRLPLASQ